MRLLQSPPFPALLYGLALLLACQPAHAVEPQSQRVLYSFLASEQSGEMQLLSNCLETFNLEQPQIDQLLAAARKTTSEERRNLIWQALRQTRSTAARDYLNLHLVQDCDHNSRVRYLRSLDNLAPFDVPMLTALYQGADKTAQEPATSTSSHGIREDDLRDVLVQLATRDVSTLAAAAPTWPEEFRNEKLSQPNVITARRREQARQAQTQLLRWIAQHAESDSHRLAAIASAYKILDSGEQPQFSRELLAAPKTPEERVRLYPLLLRSYGMDLVPLLVRDDENETSKLGLIQALHEHGSSYGYSISSIRHGISTFVFVSKNDPSPKVRAAMELLLKRLRESSY